MDVFVMLFHVSRYFGRRLQENHPLYSKDKSSLSNIKQHSITVGLTFPVLLVWGLSVANHNYTIPTQNCILKGKWTKIPPQTVWVLLNLNFKYTMI